MAGVEVSLFLTHLAADRHVAARTQNQALDSLRFLYRQFWQRKLGFLDNVERAKRPAPGSRSSMEGMSKIIPGAIPPRARLFACQGAHSASSGRAPVFLPPRRWRGIEAGGRASRRT